MKFKKYRQKPIIVKAYQWLKYNQDDEVGHYTDWRLNFGKCKYCGKSWKRHGWISTLQGGHMVCPGDWIIYNIEGEFYPCKPGIFKKTYEEVKIKMRTLDAMTSDERNLLLYLETRAVDYGGIVDTKHMNKEDMDIADKWDKEGFVKFGRIKFHSITVGTHWCELSDEAWNITHAERKAKCLRIMSRQTINKTCDR